MSSDTSDFNMASEAFVPTALLYGATVLAFACMIFFVYGVLAGLNKWNLWGPPAAITGLVIVAAIITGIQGWRQYWPKRKQRSEAARRIQIQAVEADEIPSDESMIQDVAWIQTNEYDKPQFLLGIGDCVLGNCGLAFLYRYKPVQQSTAEIIANYVAGGAIGGAIVDASRRKEVDRENQASMKRTASARRSESGKTLRRRLESREESFFIPVCDIVSMRGIQDCVCEIHYGFHRSCLAHPEIARLHDWLRAARLRLGVTASDSSPPTLDGLMEQLVLCQHTLSKDVRERINDLTRTPTLMRSTAKVLPLKACRLIGQLRSPSSNALELRKLALNHIVDDQLPAAGVCAILISPVAVLATLVANACLSDGIGSQDAIRFLLLVVPCALLPAVAASVLLGTLFYAYSAQREGRRRLNSPSQAE